MQFPHSFLMCFHVFVYYIFSLLIEYSFMFDILFVKCANFSFNYGDVDTFQWHHILTQNFRLSSWLVDDIGLVDSLKLIFSAMIFNLETFQNS